MENRKKQLLTLKLRLFFFLPGDILNVYFFLEYFWIVFLVVVPAIFGIVEGFLRLLWDVTLP